MRTLLALLTATALLLSACGLQAAGEDASEDASDTSMEDAGLAYAQCMRENGVDMPDPESDADGGVQMRLPEGVDPESDAFQRAEDECQPLLEGAVQDRIDDLTPEERERIQQQMLDLAECMREEGYDMPDPEIDGGGIRIGGPDSGIDPRDPQFREAMEACQDEVDLPMPDERSDTREDGQ